MAEVTITVPVPPWWAFVAYIAVGLAVDVWACCLVRRKLRVPWRSIIWRAGCRLPFSLAWPWFLIVGPALDRMERRHV